MGLLGGFGEVRVSRGGMGGQLGGVLVGVVARGKVLLLEWVACDPFPSRPGAVTRVGEEIILRGER